ncbi:DUF1441 family protein [Thioclava sp. 'Guangxiensis']|uniref:DUF1441 family protein n=1 Tax=Thioclava sp. 'Guangxiensis' TaxID=3149044 RepID=UPI0038780A84
MDTLVTLTDGSVLDTALYPLPDGLSDGVMNRAQLAIAFNVSENSVTKWVGQGMPVLTAGQNGVSYEFQLSHCYAWRRTRDEQSRATKATRDAHAMQASLAFRNLDEEQEEEEGGLTAKQLREWSEAEYHRNRVAEQRGELVRAAKVSELLEDLIGVVATALGTMPDHLERDLGLGVEEVAKVEARCDKVVMKMRERIERSILGTGAVEDLAEYRQDEMGL